MNALSKIIAVGSLMILVSCNNTAKKSENSTADSAKTVEEKKPNLLFIFGDQHRRQAMGFVKEDSVITPNLDNLAKDGVYFSNAIANHPLCSPYRAMVITGQYPLTNKVIANCHSGRTKHNNFLQKENTSTFPDVLAKNGYDAGYIGKWHLEGPKTQPVGEKNVWDAYCPKDRRHGFNFWYSYNADNDHFRPHYWKTNVLEKDTIYIDEWSPIHEANVIMEYVEGGGHAPRDKDKPFALFWSINPPHTPFAKVPDKYKDMYKDKTYMDLLNRPNVQLTNNSKIKAGDHGVERKIDKAPDYFAAITGIDDQIGRVIARLKELGEYENTIIVYSADHGEMMGSQGLMHKNVWFRESLEIPLIVHWPKKIKANVDDLLISVPDYMPTLLATMGMADQIPTNVEGKDYSTSLLGGTIDAKDLPTQQLYFGSEPRDPSTGKRGVRNKQYTYAVVKNKDKTKAHYLFDRVNDPFEMKNLWGKDKELDSKMTKMLANLLTEMKDPWLDN